MRSGRTIGEKRERLETASERIKARDEVKKKQRLRVFFTILGFAAGAVGLIFVGIGLTRGKEKIAEYTATIVNPYTPTIAVVDEDAAMSGGKVTSRMREYIGMAEADFRELGYTPSRAVIPSGAIREVDFYLDNQPGFVKLTIDRGSGVSVEDADRMLRYLAGQGIAEFQYIDVRVDGKAYWK